MIKQMRVAIIGQGYVGLTITEGALMAGHQVVCIDKSAAVLTLFISLTFLILRGSIYLNSVIPFLGFSLSISF